MEKLEIRVSEVICDCVEKKQSQMVVKALRGCLIKDITDKIKTKFFCRIDSKEWYYLLNGQKMHFNSVILKNGEAILKKHSFNICSINELTLSSLSKLSDSI